jgi:NAD-dependent SIR2 family protein deacetylase
MLHLFPKLAAIVFLIGAGISACSEKQSGDTTFKEATKGFKKELTPEQRKAAIKELQTETTSKP